MNKSEFLLENFKNCQEIIKIFEHKSNILLVLYGLLMNLFFGIVKELSFIKTLDGLPFYLIVKSVFIFVLVSLISTLLLYGLYQIIIKILMPRKANHYDEDKSSLFYFNHIANETKDNFLRKVNEIPEEKYDEEVTFQIYEVSKIASEKQNNYIKLSKILFVNILLLFILAVIVY